MAKPSFSNLKGDFYDRIGKEVTAYAETVRRERQLDRDYVPRYHPSYVPRDTPAVGFSGLPGPAPRQAGQGEAEPDVVEEDGQESVEADDGE